MMANLHKAISLAYGSGNVKEERSDADTVLTNVELEGLKTPASNGDADIVLTRTKLYHG